MAVEDVEIVKPRNDKREYRRVVFKNSLEVLLISDPETDKSAASMDVRVGSSADPEGLDGLAHFLEHMLFYASEKYPAENSYFKYIWEHGGSANAYTSFENTNYHFEVNADSFEEALDRLAQFFIRPLMSEDATTREIKAVESEHQKNLQSDIWRMGQLAKHLSAADHPFHKFGTGNLNTLEVWPKEKGIDTRHEVIKFYKEHYSANLMHLVVYAKENLDEIQRMVKERFQEVPNSDKSCFSYSGEPCSKEHLQILVRAVPITEGHTLKIMWPITPEVRHYKEAPCQYASHLIGHQGEGSVFYILKSLGWATNMYALEGKQASDFSIFYVVINLTDTGHEHMQEIVGLLFKFICLLQQSGLCKWIFDELSAVHETEFHYQDKYQPLGYVRSIASNMQLYPPKDWLVRSSLPSNFSPDIIQMFLNELSPSTVRIFWESKKFEGQTEMVEPWYGTAYSVEKLSDSVIQEWIASAPSENLHLPVPNILIPKDFSLKTEKEQVKYPVLLRKSYCSTVWYKPDTMFFTPKAHVKIDFNCPYASNSPEAEVLTHLFTRLLVDSLEEYAHYAAVAGLYYYITHMESGFQVTVNGYNDKLQILLDKVIEKIATFKVKNDRFAVIKEMVTKQYQNYKFRQPHQQAMDYCSLIIGDNEWPKMERLEILPNLEAEDLATFFLQMLSRTFLLCYVAGNVLRGEAESMIQHIEDVFFKGPKPICHPLFPSQHLTNRVVKLEKGMKNIYLAEGLNPKEENSAVVYYIQCRIGILEDLRWAFKYYRCLSISILSSILFVHRDDYILNVKLQLFALIAKESAFHQLRSVEQLGYIAHLDPVYDSGIYGVYIYVQSAVKDPKYIDSRVEAFLKTYENKLYEMSDDEFKGNVNALINMKLEKHKNLWEECGFFWREIFDGTLKFDRREAEVAALRLLKKQELVDFFNAHIKVGAPKKKTLSVQVYGSLHLAEYKAHKSEPPQYSSAQIDDIFSFRRSRPLYGSFRGVANHTKS